MATLKCVIYNDDGSSIVGDFDENSYVSKHLQLKEVANPSCKESVKYVQHKGTRIALACWEYVRERYGKPISISCSYRSPSWNASIPGAAPDSLHLEAEAFDNQLPGMSDSLFSDFCHWAEIAAEKYGVQVEVIREPYGFHLGFGRLPYTTKKIYIADARKVK